MTVQAIAYDHSFSDPLCPTDGSKVFLEQTQSMPAKIKDIAGKRSPMKSTRSCLSIAPVMAIITFFYLHLRLLYYKIKHKICLYKPTQWQTECCVDICGWARDFLNYGKTSVAVRPSLLFTKHTAAGRIYQLTFPQTRLPPKPRCSCHTCPLCFSLSHVDVEETHHFISCVCTGRGLVDCCLSCRFV